MVYNNEHKDTYSSFNRHFPGEPRLLEEGMTIYQLSNTQQQQQQPLFYGHFTG